MPESLSAVEIRTLMTWGDAYEIRFGAGVDEVSALAVVLVIDACIEAERK